MELLSVIIPVYNSEVYLDRCLYSVLKQSYTNLEIIIIDDGATDHSSEIIHSFQAKDNRIKHFHIANIGQARARGLGLSKATGDYVAFLDSDDFIDSDMYETLIRNIKGASADISICGYYKYLNEASKKITPKHNNKIEILTKDDALTRLYTSNIESYVWNKVYKRELFNDLEFPNNKAHEDISIMYKLFNRANKIVYQDTPKYYFVQRPNSILNDKDDTNSIDLLSALIARYKEARDTIDIELRRKMVADIYSVYVEECSKGDKEDVLFFVKSFLLSENLDFKPYLDSLKRKQLKLRRLGIKYHNQFKIINLIRKK